MMAGEIKILGAGIAGLTTSIDLAKGGFDVTVFEKSSLVGSRFYSDFQAWRIGATRRMLWKF